MDAYTKKRVNIFCCCADQDRSLLARLRKHLSIWERQDLIVIWANTDISGGTDTEEYLTCCINTADIILCLVSADFLGSESCIRQVISAMTRYGRGEVCVIPIILRPVYWQAASFGRLSALPTNGEPVVSAKWHNRDYAFDNIAKGIYNVVVKLQSKSQSHTSHMSLHRMAAEQPFPPLISLSPPVQRPRRHSLAVIAMLIILTVLLFVGTSLGIYTTVTANWSRNATAVAIDRAGQNWTPQNVGTRQQLNAVVWLDNRFIVTGYKRTLLTSSDGHTWTTSYTGNDPRQYLQGVAWSGTQFVVVGDKGTLLTSPDGYTWTPQNTHTLYDLYDVTWSKTQFVVVGQAGTILTSSNGHTWAVENTTITQQSLDDVVWSGTQFVVVGHKGTLLTSPDGDTWTSQDTHIQYDLQGVTWSGRQFVAVGDNGTLLTSPDGDTWTFQDTHITQQMLFDVAWSSQRFVVVGQAGTILTSPDGHTWTSQNSDTLYSLFDVTWSGTQFVAVGEHGILLTSP